MFHQNYLLAILLSSYFLTEIMSCNLRYDSTLSESEMADDLVIKRNFKDSSIRLRRDSPYNRKLIAISTEDEAEYGPRMIRRVIYPNDTKLRTMNDSQSSRLLNSEYYRQKEEYKLQQILRKRFNETVPVGCHLIEGPPPAVDPSAGTPPAPPGGTPPAPGGTPPAPVGTPPAPGGTPPDPGTPPAPAGVRRRKRQAPSSGNGTVDPNAPPAAPAAATPAAPPANNSAPSPGAGAAPQPPTTVITTTTPKPVSLVCPPSTTIATTTQAPAPAPAGAPPAAPPSGNPPATGPAQNATAPAPVDPGQNATAPVAPTGP